MIDWLGIDHLFELSGTEAIAGFFTPLAIFAAFLLAQVILPGRRVPGYVKDENTGEPRQYRLNGLLVFLIAIAVWWFELTGMPRDWFLPFHHPRRGGRNGIRHHLLVHRRTQPAQGNDKDLHCGVVDGTGTGVFLLQ